MAINTQEVANVGGNLVIRGFGGSDLAQVLARAERWTLVSASPSVIVIRPDDVGGRSKLWRTESSGAVYIQFGNGKLGYAIGQKIPVKEVESSRDGVVLVRLLTPLSRDPLKTVPPKEAPTEVVSARPAEFRHMLSEAIGAVNKLKRERGMFELKVKPDGTLQAILVDTIE